MRRTHLLIIAAIAAGTAAVVLFADRDSSQPAEAVAARIQGDRQPATPVASAPTDIAAPGIAADSGAVPAAGPVRARPPDPMAANFAATDDLLAFVEGVHATAEGGDGAAAYYMFRALDRCQTEYGMRFGNGRRERSFEEVLGDASIVRQFGEADLRRIHGQCQRLRESDPARFGPSDDWLAKSSDAGYPRGQAEWAQRMVTGEIREGEREVFEPARLLARAALASRDPEVFVPVSFVVRALSGSDPARDASWFVAACQRGLDCSAGSEMKRVFCSLDPGCQPSESSIDVLMRGAGVDRETIERRARDINAAIDAGRFEELGL